MDCLDCSSPSLHNRRLYPPPARQSPAHSAKAVPHSVASGFGPGTMDDDRLKKALAFAEQATDRDRAGDYANALDLYRRCLDHWQLASKYQKNPLLKQRLYEKMEPYTARAEAIKQYLETEPKRQAQTLINARITAPIEALSQKNGHTAKTTRSQVDGSTLSSQSPFSSHSAALNSSPVLRPSSSTSSLDIAPRTTSKPKVDQEYEQLLQRVASAIVAEKPNVTWDAVAGLNAAKDALQEAVILPTRFPSLFVGERQPWKGVLLYGPPGTGKTHLAKACATEADATFISVSSSDLMSKWQGESEKLVRALFDLARRKSPSVIFIDEVDSICSTRNARETESSRRVKTEFLVQMEGLSNAVEPQEDTEHAGSPNPRPSHKRILILGATNEPWCLDPAVRRRFERRIFIPLPNTGARRQMFKIHVGKTPHVLSQKDFDDLAQRTEGYSGADIAVLVRDALFEPVRRCRLATHFKKVWEEATHQWLWTPCSPSDPDPSKEARELMSLPSGALLPPRLAMKDFKAALEQSKSSVTAEELERYDQWTQQFGMDGQRC